MELIRQYAVRVDNSPIVAYVTSKGSIMKLQRRSKDQWQWVNLSNSEKYISKVNVEGWNSNTDFSDSVFAINSTLLQFPTLAIYKFDTFEEFVDWVSKETTKPKTEEYD